MAFSPARLWPFEDRIVAEATEFVASAFQGRATYSRRIASSREEAIAVAADLYEGDRPVAIYAVSKIGQAMIGSWIPDV